MLVIKFVHACSGKEEEIFTSEESRKDPHECMQAR